MSKPNTLQDLLIAGEITEGDIKKIARDIFDGVTDGPGPQGYIITAVHFDDLPDSCQQFVVKAIAMFTVENILDAKKENSLSKLQRLGQEFDADEGPND